MDLANTSLFKFFFSFIASKGNVVIIPWLPLPVTVMAGTVAPDTLASIALQVSASAYNS